MNTSTPETSLVPMQWTHWTTRFLFFTGKGGVGKTTIAATVALSLAQSGKRVLIISTDPASNLDDVFEMEAPPQPTSVPAVPNLSVMNLDPEAAALAYRENLVGPYRGVLPEATVRSMEEQFSGSCTVEIAAFNEFTDLVCDPELVQQFDHIVFDTAPTGHTLRLLSLPGAWSGFIEAGSGDASCLGPLAGLEAQREQYAATVAALADAAQTTLVLVSRPERSALNEAARAGGELREMGLNNQLLVLNGVFECDTQGDPIAEALRERQQQALRDIPDSLRDLPIATVPLVASSLTGISALQVLCKGDAVENSVPGVLKTETETASLDGLPELVRELAGAGHGVIMTMGKGGVGKTTLAATIALALAHEGHTVHLSTTDPAAHLAQTVGENLPENLTVSRIDPVVERERYADEVLAKATNLDEAGRALLQEDLRSPCTEEIAVFQAFSRMLSKARNDFVVLDTAPTGHTLLLLDATGAYHREIAKKFEDAPGRFTTPLMRLQDPEFTRVLIVTLPEPTPVLEAERLQADLRRAGIEPFGWVVNASLAASEPQHPLLAARARLEAPFVRRVVDELAKRAWLVPWQADAPTGQQSLLSLAAV